LLNFSKLPLKPQASCFSKYLSNPSEHAVSPVHKTAVKVVNENEAEHEQAE